MMHSIMILLLSLFIPLVTANPPPPPAYASSSKGRHIGIIGSGYSGLAAACELRLLGYEVTVVSHKSHRLIYY